MTGKEKISKEEIARRKRGYPAICLTCGAKTTEVKHEVKAGKYKGIPFKTWECTNAKCKAIWGGYV
jgi:hypothetical protein